MKEYTWQELELNGLMDEPLNEGSTYTVEPVRVNQTFITLLAEAHDSLTGYGKEHSNCASNELSDAADNYTTSWITVPVLVMKEDTGEPGYDWIHIYNWEGVMRMTGIISDPHGGMEVYKINQT